MSARCGKRLESRIVEHGLERGDVAGARPVVIVRRHETEEAARSPARCCGAALARRHDPGVAADIFDPLPPQVRIGVHRVAIVERPPGRRRLPVSNEPIIHVPGRIDAALAVDERGDCRRRVHVLRAQVLLVDQLERKSRPARRSACRAGCGGRRETAPPLAPSCRCRDCARRTAGIADVALDEIGLARALLELARLRDQFRRRVRQDRLAAAHQPRLGEQGGVDVKQPAVRVPRQGVDRACRSSLRARLASVKSDGLMPAMLQIADRPARPDPSARNR